MNWFRYDPARLRLTLTVYIQPNARTTEVVGFHGGALKLRVAAPAVENKANAALIDFLHQWFKLPASHIKIQHGARGRHKVVTIDHPDAALLDLLSRMEPACPAYSHNK